MSEELQSLLERIERDGIDKAKTHADTIVKAAEAKAAELVKAAEARAAEMVKAAEAESRAFEARSAKALAQAARDIILGIERDVAAIFARIAAHEVAASLDIETVRTCVAGLIQSYAQADADGTRLAITLSEAQHAEVVEFLVGRFQSELADGRITVEGSSAIRSGFKVAVTDKDVEHDFTGDAVTEALGALLHPDLAAIIKGDEA